MSHTNILLETGTNELEVVEFFLDEDGYRGYYGVNVAKVLEIIRMQPITSMPQMRHPAVMGAFPHRDGRVVPMVDLATYLEKKRIASSDPKVIVTEFNNIVTGFLVSGVNRIHRLSWVDVEAPGNFLQHMSNNSITGVVRLEGRVVFILDMESIVAELDPNLAIHLGKLPDVKVQAKERYTVVHADDSGNVRNLVRNLLTQSGRFNVISKADGEETWLYLQEVSRTAQAEGKTINDYVDALITDIEMPRMDGLALCRHIKEDAYLKTLPVAIFSSLVTDKLEHKGVSVGADAQFAKPDLQVLSERVLELVGAR